MDSELFVRVPYTEAHTHFNVWVKDFPQLHDHGHHEHGHHDHKPLSPKQKILDHLRKEMIELSQNKKEIEKKLCYRSCFKILDREYAEFCLKEKCKQPNFNEAAKALNLLK